MGGRGGSGQRAAAITYVPVADPGVIADMDIRDSIEDVVNITGQTSPWVSLQRLRVALSTRGWDSDRQDRELSRFVSEGKASLLAEEDRGLLTKELRRAALAYGDDNYHLIRLK